MCKNFPCPGRFRTTIHAACRLGALCLVLALSLVTDGSAATVETIAGTGTSGFTDGIDATTALIAQPTGVFVAANGDVYFTDQFNDRVRKIDNATGLISTIAGNGGNGYTGDGAAATAATMNNPEGGIWVEGNDLYFSDTYNDVIRHVDLVVGNITTFAGGGADNSENVLATTAQLDNPTGIYVYNNILYYADLSKQKVRQIDLGTNLISTFAGDGAAAFGGDGGLATAASLCFPHDVVLDDTGTAMYIGDTGNHRVRRVDMGTNIITTVAGTGVAGFDGDGVATAQQLNNNEGVYARGTGTDVYIADTSNDRIRLLDTTTGMITTIVGTGVGGDNGDGLEQLLTQIDNPRDVYLDANDNIYFPDAANDRVRKIEVVPIPTFSEWTIIALALAMVLYVFWRMQ